MTPPRAQADDATADAARPRHRRRHPRTWLTSLKGRLLTLAALVLAAGLTLFALQLSSMFRQHVERSAIATLQLHLEQLVVSLHCDAGNRCRATAQLADPRFARPLGGLYWQVNDTAGRPVARSRSLWDAVLPAPPPPLPARGHLTFDATGPDGERLLVLARRLLIQPEEAPLANGRHDHVAANANSRAESGNPLIFMVAMDRAGLEQAVQGFRRDLIISLLLLGALLLAALLAQVWLGLKPLARIRHQIAELRTGRRQHLDAPAVAEIRTLVEELEALLQAQQRHMEQARARAGNLAHGLKTPLAALLALARDMAQRGHTEDARAVLRHATQLRQHVEHELSRHRVRGDRTVHEACAIAPAAEQLIRTLRTLHRDRPLQWTLEVEDGLAVRMLRGDLLELLGNLLDNAAKWTRSRVRISARRGDADSVLLKVEDDGPGVPAAHRRRIVERGVRLDEKVPGSGIGLSIVQEIAEAYGGALALTESPLGGLCAEARLPSASSSTTSPTTRRERLAICMLKERKIEPN